MKHFLTFGILLLLMVTCKTGNDNKTNPSEAKVIETTVDELMATPDKFVNQQVTFIGLADHVCRETGKKMFLVGTDPKNRIRVNTGDNMGTFDIALEGNNVTVTGKFVELRITEEYLKNWEAELKQGNNAQADEIKEPTKQGEGGHAASRLGAAADQGTSMDDMETIANYRTMLKEQNTDHLSFYSVECTEYKTKEN
jgi:hypothetical protein